MSCTVLSSEPLNNFVDLLTNSFLQLRLGWNPSRIASLLLSFSELTTYLTLTYTLQLDLLHAGLRGRPLYSGVSWLDEN